MSEKLHNRHEQHHERNHELEARKEALQVSAEKKAAAARHEHAEKLDEIRSQIEAVAKRKHEHPATKPEHERHESKQPVLANRELKDLAYRRTLKRVQSKLPAPARAFSKVIHNPAVEAASELAGKTVARPSGVLAGGVAAFLGSSLFLWVARHYGYEYNYVLFALCFVGGFFVGLLVEFGLRLANRRSR